MSEKVKKTQNEKLNKSKPRLSNRGKQIVAMAVVIAFIMSYIVYECYSVTNVDLETVTALQSQVYQTIDTTALAVRDEKVIDNANSGVTVACAAEGEKIKAGGKSAMVFSSNAQAQDYSQKLQLESQLDYYLDMASQSAGTATDIESINSEIIDDVNSFIRDTSSGNMSDTEKTQSELNNSITRRQLIIGETIDFSTITNDIQNQIKAIDSSCEPNDYLTTDSSGIFSSAVDGCESMFDYENISSINESTLKSYINDVKKTQNTKTKTKHLGKLITSYAWYLVSQVDANDIKGIDNGDRIFVAMTDSDKVIKCTVISGAEHKLGDKKTVLVLKCADMDSEIAAYRLEDIEIRYDSYEGIKVPASSVHVVDGKSGVYALVSSQVKFRQATTIYSQGDYVWLDYSPDKDGGIRLYDQIITKGKDLYDGKVYT